MKIGIAQLEAVEDKQKNLEKAITYIKKAKKSNVDIVVFPEAYMAQISPDGNVSRADVAESINGDGPFINGLKEAAKENNIYIICGIFEKKDDESIRAYNTVVMINDLGELIYSYRKTHLYDSFSVKESNGVVPGDKAQEVIKTKFGNIGLMICYEIRFPEISRELTLGGADVIIIPTAWVEGRRKEYHWEVLLKARAIENTTYIVGAGKIGMKAVGNSMIIDPMGVPVASAGEEEELIIADIDLERLKRVKEKLPSLEHRREDIYKQYKN